MNKLIDVIEDMKFNADAANSKLWSGIRKQEKLLMCQTCGRTFSSTIEKDCIQETGECTACEKIRYESYE